METLSVTSAAAAEPQASSVRDAGAARLQALGLPPARAVGSWWPRARVLAPEHSPLVHPGDQACGVTRVAALGVNLVSAGAAERCCRVHSGQRSGQCLLTGSSPARPRVCVLCASEARGASRSAAGCPRPPCPCGPPRRGAELRFSWLFGNVGACGYCLHSHPTMVLETPAVFRSDASQQLFPPQTGRGLRTLRAAPVACAPPELDTVLQAL